MRKIKITGVLLVGLILSLVACASPAPDAIVPAQVPDEGANRVNAPAAAPAETPAPAQAAAINPVPADAPAPAANQAAAPAPVAETPGDFTLSNLKITPGTVAVGNDVTVTVTVANPGGQTATEKVTLNLVGDGEACPTFIPPVRDITLAGGASQQVTFKLSMGTDMAGSYTVSVGKLSGKLVVQ